MAVLILDEKWPVLLIKIFFWPVQKAIGYHAADLASLPRDTFQEKDLALERPFCIFAFQSTIQKLLSKLKVWQQEKLERFGLQNCKFKYFTPLWPQIH